MIKQKTSILCFIAIIIAMAFANDNNRLFHLGKRSCTLKTLGSSDTLASFISLHDDENTAVEAFLLLADTLNGILFYELQQTGERLIKYGINKTDYLFDPNGIFSKDGIKNMLARFNRKYPQQLMNKLTVFADTLLNIIKPSSNKSYIVSIHNNTNNKFSIVSYKNSKNASAVYIAPGEDVDDFFIVTSRNDFDYFKALQQNVVLQSENAVDDGSLSIYCQKNNIPYINIEAEHGHTVQQMKMIQQTYALLTSKRLANQMEQQVAWP